MALHLDGMEAMLGVHGEERSSLTTGNAVVTPTSSRYHLAKHGGDPRQLVVAGTRQDVGTRRREPTRHGVAMEGDAAGCTSGGAAQGAIEAAAAGQSGVA